MPKPNFNKPSWKTQYNEHDYRVGGGGGGSGGVGGGNTRHVKFKTNRRNNKRGDKDWAGSIRAHLEDEDYDMVGTSGGSNNTGHIYKKTHFNKKRGNRSDSPAPVNKRRLLDGPMSWFRVTLPHGNKYEKDFILRTLLQKVEPLTLWPITWSTNGSVATFYVDDFKVAEKLNDLDRQIQMPDGFRMIIKVNSGMPNVDINTELKEKIKITMAKRYNNQTKALDLTKFHIDPYLQQYFCALFKPIVLLTVLDIIAENIPELEALNLFDNKITQLTFLKKINEKLPNLKTLHIGNNRLRDISMLDPLIGLPILDLVLNGNPLCSKFKDQESYIGEVRKRFPKVMKLDGVELPPPISFDLVEDTQLPTKQQTFLCNQDGEIIVRQFLEQYFQIFDTDNRQPLIQAYHESAQYSLTMSYPYGQQKEKCWLNWYIAENRNLLRLTDTQRRHKLLRQGQVGVVSFLQEMPLTKHDIHSFTVDLTLFTPQMICLTITGMFKELKSGHKTQPIRYFFRTLVIVPAGSGFCIVNEMVHITNATEEQAKDAFKIVVQAPIPAAISSPVVQQATTTTAPPPEPDDLTKQQMVQTMAEQSGMNLEWSTKCLTETQWDFARAAAIFADLHKQGVIPAEAFVK